MAEVTCNSCGENYEDVFFRQMNVFICMGCESKKADETKRGNRFRSKAGSTLRRHGERYIKQGLVNSIQDFAEKFGWDINKIEHQLRHDYSNGCLECGDPYAAMGHGLYDITVDIINPSNAPYWGINTRLICQTCNRKKGKTAPDIWAKRRSCWNKWKRRQALIEQNPLIALPLWASILKNR
jgi:hypothetical protein